MKTEFDIFILFSDLDGTLLDDEKRISSQTLWALQEVRKKGIKTIISTSRILRTALPYAQEIASDGVIFCGGAGILYNDGKLVLRPMLEQVLTDILRRVDHTFDGIRYSVTTPNAMYTNFIGDNTICITEDTVGDIIKPLRIVFYHPNLELEAFLKKHWEKECNILVLEGKNIMVTEKEATKENAMAAVLRYYGIGSRNAAYFGDDLSDCACIKYAGYGVATQNAAEVVKQRAYAICKSNNDDGVAEWISTHILCDQ